MTNPPSVNGYVGRFAPSPTGDLHFGSLVAAVASYLQARQAKGKWLLRMEDIDPPRAIDGSAQRIIRDLSRFGFNPDEPILFQQSRSSAYEAACQQLILHHQAYWCGCSRSDMPASGVYPGTCRDGIPPGKAPRAIRVRVDARPIEFQDRIQGATVDVLSTSIGDFVIRRADGLFAYQLAVVVDDAFQNVTEVVRGADLLDSTSRQIHLQDCLGLPTPNYAHVPVVVLPDGTKLSKSVRSDPLRNATAATALRQALTFLGHPPPHLDLAGTWEWAMQNWSLDAVPQARTRSMATATA